MNYSLEMITTVAACDALLAQAAEDKENLERRRRNLDESIGNFGERTHDYSTELQAVVTLRIHPKSQAGIDRLVARLEALPETLCVYLLSGADDVLVHLAVSDADHLRTVVLSRIATLDGVVDERTSIVFEHRRRTVVDVLDADGSQPDG